MRLKKVKEFNSDSITQDIAAELFALIGLQSYWKKAEVKDKGYTIKDLWHGVLPNGAGSSMSSDWEVPGYTDGIHLREHNGVEIKMNWEIGKEGKHYLIIDKNGRGIVYIYHRPSELKSIIGSEVKIYEDFTSYTEYPCNPIKLVNFYFEHGFYTVEEVES